MFVLEKQSVPLTVRGRRHANAFDQAMVGAMGGDLHAASLRTIQVNVGLKCNLACHHCHVESGPNRAEAMDWETMQMVLRAARNAAAETIDITGGAPEMNPHLRRLVAAARAQGHEVIVRTNLTIALELGYEDLPKFFRRTGVHLIASLPCYLEENVDRQRGRHVYVESIEVIRRLNAVGFGVNPKLQLDLVYNPGGPALPPPQEQLEADYRRELLARFNLRFTRLLTITNMPIGRFQHDLDRSGKGDAYRTMRRERFNPQTVENPMCRHQIHIGHDGTLHDCDFNYAVGMSTRHPAPRHIRDFTVETLINRRVATAEHCFGCTAGSGSSCTGAIA